MALLSEMDHAIRDYQIRRKAQKAMQEQRRRAAEESRKIAQRRARLRREEGYF